MKRTRLLLTAIAFTTLGVDKVPAQTRFEIPQNVQLKVKEDYERYEPDIVEADKWLEATDLDKETDKRKQVDAFAMQWILGCPNINVEVYSQLAKIYGKNQELLMLYMLGYSRCHIENKATTTKQAATKAGLMSMINVYKKGINITRSKEMERVIKLADKNKLDDYITDRLR